MEDNHMYNSLVNLYNRCQAIRLRNYLNPKLEAFNLLLCFRSVCKQLDYILNDLTYYLPFDDSVLIDYAQWYNCFVGIETLDIRDFSGIITTEPKHIVDFLFPGTMIDNNRESAEEIRRAIEILTSDVYMKGENLVNSLYYAKIELLNRLLALDKELKKRKGPEFRAKMLDNLFYHYTTYDEDGNKIGKFVDDFEEWKDKCLNLDNDMLETYLWTMLYNLMKHNFLIVDKVNFVKKKANIFFEETKFDLVDGIDIETEELKKKYYVLRNLMDYENGKFVLKEKEILGKYLLSHNKDISREDFLEFKFFLDTIELIYEEMEENNRNQPNESDDGLSIKQNINIDKDNVEMQKDEMGKKIKCAIDTMWEEKVLLNKYDYAFIKLFMDNNDNLPHFKTSKDFLNYMKTIGCPKIPSESTFNNYYNKNDFLDGKIKCSSDRTEKIRRNEIIKRFCELIE